MAAAIPISRTTPQRIAVGHQSPGALPDGVLYGSDPKLYAMLTRALEAARSAGAIYAEARYQVEQYERLFWRDGYPSQDTRVAVGVGVRALYQGYWGYTTLLGVVKPDDLVRLGREATAQAKIGAKGRPRIVELAPRPIVTQGTWVTPGATDPFSIPWGEKADLISGLDRYLASVPADMGTLNGGLDFRKKIQTVAASDGASYSQTLYDTSLEYAASRPTSWRTGVGGLRQTHDIVSSASAGWEYVATLPALMEREAERLSRETELMRFRQPVDIGRYDIVFDGVALGGLVSETIGQATLLDRAMGYKANDVGTSYLNDPLAMLGTYKIGSPLLTVTANRSIPGGAATVGWDAEGVVPDEAVLVKEGILTDFQTTRESASWLAPYYQKLGKSVRSHGGTDGWIAYPPHQVAHNLTVEPAARQTSFEDLCKGVKKGLAVLGSIDHRADQQALNVESTGHSTLIYEITNGKLGRVLGETFYGTAPVLMLRAPDFWKNLTELGGSQTVRNVGTSARGDTGTCTVSAPAALVTNIVVTNDRGG